MSFPALARLARGLARYLRAWVVVWAVFGALTAAAIALGPLEGVPHVQDEVVYQMQSRMLAQGRLWEEPLLPRAAYHFEFVINADGRRYGVFPNGWPLVLALGTLCGASVLVNPLLHGLTILVGAWLCFRVSGRAAAFLAAPLLAFCPGLLILASSRMSHTLCALLTLLATTLLLTGEQRRGTALCAGAAIGWLWMTRPLDGLVVTTVLSVAALLLGRASSLRHALPAIAAGVALLGISNWLFEGSPFTFPQSTWFARGEPPHPHSGWRYSAHCNDLGWGAGHGCMPLWGSVDHSLGRGLRQSWLNWKLAGGLWYGFWPLAVLSFAAWLSRSARPLLFISASLFSALSLAYSAYWYHGAAYGPRFLHSAAPLALATLAVALAALARRSNTPAVTGLVLLLAFAERMPAVISELDGYWGVDARLQQLKEHWDKGRALLFVAYGGARANVWQPLPNTSEEYMTYPVTMRRGMWIDEREPQLAYAEFQPRLVDELLRRFPGRTPYVIVLHDHRKLDYMVPLSAMPKDEEQVSALPVPGKIPYLEKSLPGATSLRKYYGL